jgi:hypothetical protein
MTPPPPTQVDYHESFRLLLLTRNSAIQLPPDASALLAVTNFSVTTSGLSNQLLSATLQVGLTCCTRPHVHDHIMKRALTRP